MTTSFPEKHDSRYSLKEQLRLFAFDFSPTPSPDILIRVQNELNKRERLSTLLEGELNFHGENSGYASHDIHAFAAKFPPQLPRVFIRGLTNPGDFVLDPMMGSGTAVVEALIEGRRGVGFDIDPLALRLGQVKTTPLDIGKVKEIGTQVIINATTLLLNREAIDQKLADMYDQETKEFINYWFLLETQYELMALYLAIKDVPDHFIRRLLELTFSSIIITKSGGVSMARDLAHSRPHLDITKKPKNAIEQFSIKLRKNLKSISQLNNEHIDAFAITGNARSMPIADGSIDLIVTSPPYANAIDYMRAHKFSLVWFGESIKGLSGLRSKYIGSERIGKQKYGMLPDDVEIIVQQLGKLDANKAAILRKYFLEMNSVIGEMYRVLKNDAIAVVVIGTSLMRGIDVQTHLCLATLASNQGFDVVGVVQRVLDRNKRMMPARFGKKSNSMIEQRMNEEYVIGLFKQ